MERIFSYYRQLLMAFAVCVFSLVSCNRQESGMTAGQDILWLNTSDDITDVALSEYLSNHVWGWQIADAPKSIVKYFEGVPDGMLSFMQYYDDQKAADMEAKAFWKNLEMLDDYAAGKSDYYPSDEILCEIYKAIDRYVNISTHSGANSPYENSYLVLAFRLVQQLVRLCPDVELISDSFADGVGVIELKEVNNFPYLAVILVPEADGTYTPALIDSHLVEVDCTIVDNQPVYNFYARDPFGAKTLYVSLVDSDEGWVEFGLSEK